MSRPAAKSTWVVSACFLLLWIAVANNIIGRAREHDFLNIYTGASLAWEGKFGALHDAATQLERERQLAPGTVELVPFVRPAFYALLIAPLAALPFRAAFWAWIGLQVAVSIGCCAWAYRRFGADAVLYGCMYAPLAMGILNGQDGAFLLAITIAAYTLEERNAPWAGAVLGLGLEKFHLFALWPLVLIAARKWRMLAAFAGCGAMLAGLSLWLSGTDGIARYLDLLTRKDLARLLPSPEKNVNLQAILINFGIDSTLAYVLLGGMVAGLAAYGAVRAPAWRRYGLAIAGSLLIVPHAYAYDASMLLAAAWFGIFLPSRRITRIAAATLCLPVTFLAGLAGPPFSAAMAVSIAFYFGCVVCEPTICERAPEREKMTAAESR